MITVFGLGFVGLTTALGFAHLGYKVYGIDVDENRKEILKGGANKAKLKASAKMNIVKERIGLKI